MILFKRGDRVRTPTGVGTVVAIVEPGGSWMGAMGGRLHGYDSGPLRRRWGDRPVDRLIVIAASGVVLHGLTMSEVSKV